MREFLSYFMFLLFILVVMISMRSCDSGKLCIHFSKDNNMNEYCAW